MRISNASRRATLTGTPLASDPTIRSSPPLTGESITFAGALASMTHAQAGELVATHGGQFQQGVTKQTTMLVAGDVGCLLEADGSASKKLEAVESLRRAGHDIRLISESDWLQLIGLTDRAEADRCYTIAMLAELLETPPRLLRRWERVGLIKPTRKVGRLSYYDFQEVTQIRRLSTLLADGVAPKQLEQTLHQLQSIMPGSERPLSRLQLLVHDTSLMIRDGHGLLQAKTGQRVFDFDEAAFENHESITPTEETIPFEAADAEPTSAAWSALEWFYEGCRLSETDDVQSAIHALRKALATHRERLPLTPPAELIPHPAEVSFHLADALYRSGDVSAASERYQAALEYDPDYLEAWIQLGCLLNERGREPDAERAFREALDRHPDYPDANLHLANTLDSTGRTAEAREYWFRYLEYTSRGPWADHARQRLSADLG